MQTESYPTQPTTPTQAGPAQEPALHLLGGIWIASCPTCGYQLTTARTQERCERRASRRTCPICREDP
jgi:NAD-dependent SIR2 family protein deacetylase